MDNALNPSFKIGTHGDNLPAVPQYGRSRLQHSLGRLVGAVAPHCFFDIGFDTLHLFSDSRQRGDVAQRSVLVDKRKHCLLGLRKRRYRFDECARGAVRPLLLCSPCLQFTDLQRQKPRRIEFLYGKANTYGMQLF